MADEPAAQTPKTGRSEGVPRKARILRVRVVENDRPAVNIRVPIGVAKWGMKVAQTFSPHAKHVDLDWESLMAMVKEGEPGKIVEVGDEAEHRTVEVWIE